MLNIQFIIHTLYKVQNIAYNKLKKKINKLKKDIDVASYIDIKFTTLKTMQVFQLVFPLF